MGREQRWKECLVRLGLWKDAAHSWAGRSSLLSGLSQHQWDMMVFRTLLRSKSSLKLDFYTNPYWIIRKKQHSPLCIISSRLYHELIREWDSIDKQKHSRALSSRVCDSKETTSEENHAFTGRLAHSAVPWMRNSVFPSFCPTSAKDMLLFNTSQIITLSFRLNNSLLPGFWGIVCFWGADFHKMKSRQVTKQFKQNWW
jgi:hypothetical protein